MSSTTVTDLAAAARETGVVWAGLFTLGIGFGVLVTDQGLPWWLAPLSAAVLFAGSVEFLLVGMLVATAPLGAIALTTFLVNFRHLFYGLSFPLHRVAGRGRKAYSVYALCDEAYALTTSKDPDTLSSGRILWTQAGLHGSWASGALVGALAGATLLSDVKGLDFILIALFVALAIDAWRIHHDPMTLTLAIGSATISALLFSGEMLLAAMTLFALALVGRHLLQSRPEQDNSADYGNR